MTAGHLQEKNGYFYVVLSYKDNHGKRRTKWIPTGYPVKGNKKKAEAFLMEQRAAFAVLAVMLERSKILVERDAKELEDGSIRRVYEDRKQGDTFVILDPRLRLENLGEVQQQVVALLSGTKTLGEVAGEEEVQSETDAAQSETT